jgi:multimeric flavodoxin WrbA
MLITVLMGSPRKNGSTARIAEEIMKGANGQGAETQVYYLNELQIKGCQSCHSCINKPSASCATHDDDVNKILADIQRSNGVVFATPVYMSTMTGQMKTMLDRFYPFLKADNTNKMALGKKALWAVTQRHPDSARYLPVFEKVMLPMGFLGFSDCKIFITSGTPTLEHLLNQPEMLSKAYTLGSWLAEPNT